MFQGKDFVDEPNRAYLHMIRNLFHLTDKQTIEDICLSFIKDGKVVLSELIIKLEYLLSQKLNITNYRRILNESERLYDSFDEANKAAATSNVNLILDGINEQVISLEQNINTIQTDILRLEHVEKKIKEKFSFEHPLTEFESEEETVDEIDPDKLKEDILIWKRLHENKKGCEQKLRMIRDRKTYIEELIRKDLFIYQNLPESFEEDIVQYQEIAGQIEEAKKKRDELRRQLHENNLGAGLERKKQKLFLVVLPLVVFIISYFAIGPYWLFILPETALVTLIILFFFGHKLYNLRTQRFHAETELQITTTNMNKLESELKKISQNSILIEDIEFMDVHIERYHKYLQSEEELQRLKESSKKLEEVLSAHTYRKKLPQLIESYSEIIDIEREDLEEYLEEFISKEKSILDLRLMKESNTFAEITKLISIHHMLLDKFRVLIYKYHDNLPSGKSSSSLPNIGEIPAIA